MSSDTIDLHIEHSSDTEDEKQLTAALGSLVHGLVGAAGAARIIDDTITAALQQNTQDSIHGWQKYLWDCLGRASMAIPSEHDAQDRIVGLMQELPNLPGAESRWTLNSSNRYRYFEQWMWELDQGNFTGGRQVEHSQDATTAYINFSAFLARLLAAGVVEATRLSALINTPFTSNPLASTMYADASEAARHFSPYVLAASQWIFYAGAALYEMCEKDTLIEIGRQRWTPRLWATWKTKFAKIAAADRYDERTRRTALDTVECMSRIEKAGVVSQVVETFGFMTLKNE